MQPTLKTRPLVLSGFMATGKTTCGRALAGRCGVPFVDVDEEIEREANRSIADIWAAEGEPGFRAREQAAISRILEARAPAVIAVGGGALVDGATRRRVLDRAIVVTLEADVDTILARASAGAVRPNLGGPDPRARAVSLLLARREAYAEAHAVMRTDDVDVDTVVDACHRLWTEDPLLLPLGARSHAITFVRNKPNRLTDALATLGPSGVVVVTDSNVHRARHAWLDAALAPLAIEPVVVTLPPGEPNKTLATVGTIWDAALGAGIDRDAVVLAGGGGVPCDMAAFAASTLLRGLRLVAAPTSLLGMVDASVGGKTGFDHAAGKNLIGSFWQPSQVVIDVDHLATLPTRERAAGLAEVVKIALALDAGLLDTLDAARGAWRTLPPEDLLPVIRRAVELKIRVVSDDERESSTRAILNLGHTIGHALEAATGFARHLHGEAVAIGLVAELEAGVRRGVTPAALATRIRHLLAAIGLPTDAAPGELARARAFLHADKKRAGGRIRLPVVTEAGRVTMDSVGLAAI